MKRKSLGIIAAVLLFGGMGVFYSIFLPEQENTVILKEEETARPTWEGEESVEIEGTEKEEVYVHVCGQVKKPGVYALDKDSRVADAVEAAGGFSKKARESSVNLARRVQDGEQLYIRSVEEEEEPGLAEEKGKSLVNINSASKEELMGLPGIGEAKAEAILAYRSRHGDFKKIEDLKKIEGIKDGVLEKIRDKITI